MTIDLTAQLIPVFWTWIGLGIVSAVAIAISPFVVRSQPSERKNLLATPARVGAF